MSVRIIATVLVCLFTCNLTRAQSPGTPSVNVRVITAPGVPAPGHYIDGPYVSGRDCIALEPLHVTPKAIGLFVVDSGGFKSSSVTDWLGMSYTPQNPIPNMTRIRRFFPYLREGYTVVILLHPDGTDSVLPDQGMNTVEPVWIAPEIEEYLRQSIIEVKQFYHLQGSGPYAIDKWAINGGSSGGTLALTIGLADSTEWLSSTTTPIVNTGMQAVIANSAGIDTLNYRFPGDYSWVSRTVSSLIHPDLTGLNPNITVSPTYMTLPSHYGTPPNTRTPIQWPPIGPSIFNPLVPDEPTYQRFPERYLAATSLDDELDHVFVSWFWQQGFGPDDYDPILFERVIDHGDQGDDDPTSQLEAENWAELDPGTVGFTGMGFEPIYEALPAPVTTPPTKPWHDYFIGQRVIDKVEHSPNSDPPVLYRHGNADYVVHYNQFVTYRDKWNTIGVPPNRPQFITRQGKGHAWRDLDGEEVRKNVEFLRATLEMLPTDSDLDGLGDSVDSGAPAGSDYDPDLDGDGQLDGAEIAFEDLKTPGVTLANTKWAKNPDKCFRITRIERRQVGANWQLLVEFAGAASISYRVEATDSLVEELGSDFPLDIEKSLEYEPVWSDVGTVTYSTPNSGTQRGVFSVSQGTGPWKTKFYRVAALSGPGGFPVATTAPIGVFENVIRRDSTVDRSNFISIPFRGAEVGRYRLDSVSNTANTTSLTLNIDPIAGSIANGLLDPDSTMPVTNTYPATHYVLVERDHSVVRPNADPDDKGAEGHWWCVSGELLDASTQKVVGVTVEERGSSAIQRADALAAGIVGASSAAGVASISIRRLPTLGDAFHGAEYDGAPHFEWHIDGSSSNPASPSPFRVGDKIRIYAPLTYAIDWGPPPVNPPPRLFPSNLPLVELQFVLDSSTGYGLWADSGDLTTAVDLFSYRLRPDECFEYLAVADVLGDAESEFFAHGWVPTSDLYGYANADNGAAAGIYQQEYVAGAFNDLYGLLLMGWPFPADCRLASGFDQSSAFFDKFRIGTNSALSFLPLSSTGGAFLALADAKDVSLWGDDHPDRASLYWGADLGDYPYYAAPLESIRKAERNVSTFPAAILDWLNYFDHDGNGTIERPVVDVLDKEFRGGRGFTVFTNLPDNPGDALDQRIVEWRMRRPYRRP